MRGDGEHGRGGAGRTASDDDALLARVASGDETAWAVLVERHLSRLVGFSWRLLGARAEAEDVAQECFVRLVRKAPDWRPGEASLSTWLHRVATNLCIDRQRRVAPGSLDEVDPDVLATGDAGAIDRELDVVRTVRLALDSLPERQRAAIVLVHYQGFSNPEAAAILDVSVEAVESLLSRARRAIRHEIETTAPELVLGDLR